MAEERYRDGGRSQNGHSNGSGRSGTGRREAGARASRGASQGGEHTEGARRQTQRRRRRHRSTGLMVALYVVFIIGASALLATVGWQLANDVLALNKAPTTAVVEIDDETTLNQVAKELSDQGIIEYPWLFKLFCAVTGGEDKITAGTYTVDTDMDYRALITNLGASSTTRAKVTVTIPEGLTVQQIFELLEEKGVSTVEKLTDMAATHDYAFSFLEDIPLGDANRLEGYLFPDTYEFYKGQNPLYVINKMLQGFDARVTDEMRQEIWDSGRSIHEIIIVASMIEKETDGSDYGKIASVIYNRLNNVNASAGTNGYLQIDATLAYLTGKVPTEADKSIDSPYNTYRYPGLPAGPISNPGLASIRAAMNPDDTGYYYYALGDDGKHHFFATLREQQNFINSQERYQSN